MWVEQVKHAAAGELRSTADKRLHLWKSFFLSLPWSKIEASVTMAKLIPLCLAPLSLSLPRFIILSLCPSLLSHLAPSSSPPSCPQDHFYLNFNCHSLLPPSPSVFTPLLYFSTSSFAFLSVDNHPSFSHHLPIFDFASLAFFSLFTPPAWLFPSFPSSATFIPLSRGVNRPIHHPPGCLWIHQSRVKFFPH